MSNARKPGESLPDYIARLKASRNPQPTIPTLAPGDEDLLPDVPTAARSETDLEIDEVLDRVDIVEAYNRWCGKMKPDVGGKRESIMCSCPKPSHPDKNPSAWLNLDKNVGYCEPCSEGFDKFVIAGWHFNLDPATEFRELRERMAESLGYVVKVSGKDTWIEPAGAPPDPPAQSEVIELPPEVIDPTEEEESIGFDWRTLPVASDPSTFLGKWMVLNSDSYEPEEFYFWLGLQAIGAAIGNEVTYNDVMPVRGNLMVCLIGHTGTGKSLAISQLERLITEAMPWDPTTGAGVRMISSPASGEALIDLFAPFYVDPAVPSMTPVKLDVNGLYRESELAAFTKRVARPGNTMRETLMDFFDRPFPVSRSAVSSGSATAENHFMQMITSTQPRSIGGLMTTGDASAGFLNRWVFAYGTAKQRPARGVRRISITPAVDSLRAIRAWAGAPREVDFDQTAGLIWDDFYAEKVQPLTMSEDHPMSARLDLLAKKLLLLFAANDHSTLILERHVRSLELLWDYLLAAYGLVDRRVGNTEVQECCDTIVKYLESRPGEQVTARVIAKQSGAKRFSNETRLRALEVLVKLNYIAEAERGKRDRVVKYELTEQRDARQLATVTQLHAAP